MYSSHSCGERASVSNVLAFRSAARYPLSITFSVSMKSSSPRLLGGTSISISASFAFRRSFCNSATLIDCFRIFEIVVSCLASAGAPWSTLAITTSAPISRVTSVGRLLTSPPSMSRRPFHSTGVKIAGSAMVARIALAREPSRNTNASADTRSVATHRNGIGRSSKL